MNFRTIRDLNKLISDKISLLPDDIDIVAGVPRSGMLPASIIALSLNCQLTDLDSLLENKIYICGTTKNCTNFVPSPEKARKILIVEDSTSSGESLMRIRKKLNNFIYKEKTIILAVYACCESIDLPDIYFELCEHPRLFEWNYLHHNMLRNACMDLDGVLCRDPLPEENDDGEKYQDFITNVGVKYRPSRTIGTIVTSRLEKYRSLTENWLYKNNIQFNELIMMQYKTMKERQENGNYSEYKAEVYRKKEDSIIFIESDAEQAFTIAKLSSKPVFCTENQIFYTGNQKIIQNNAVHDVHNDNDTGLLDKLIQLRKDMRLLQEGKNWLEGQYYNYVSECKRLEEIIKEQQAWISQLEEAKKWLTEQYNRAISHK
ncbi:MAG: hypothetical protein ACM3S4_12565 [Burkholderiales bacterium]